jgi:thioredoxin reductase (NADPH)
LAEVVVKDTNTNELMNYEAAALFIFIGAKPITDWISLDLIKDEKGYLETGPLLLKYKSFKKNWPLEREPFLLETCVPGVFAAGDVRSGAMNRVASAVGEGSMAIKFVHQYLAAQ